MGKLLMRERIPSLDGLRGISILMVLVGHLVDTVSFPKQLVPLGGIANIGVLIFFVISGFLITTLLMREQDKHGRISLRNFYIRRVLRILPVSYLYIGVIAALTFLGFIHLRQHDLAFAASYLMNYHKDHSWYFGHFWSLTIEEQFYVIWPALVVLLGFRRSFVAVTMFLIVAPPGRFLLWRVFPHLPTELGLAYGADSIAMGCLLAMNFERLRTIKVLTSNFLFVILACAVSAKLYSWNVERPAHGLLYVINILIALAILRCVTVPDDFLGRILNSKALSFVGVLSYSIYVWQQLFLNGQSSRSVFPFNVGIVFVVALLSYYLVERPFLKLKSRFTKPNLAVEARAPVSGLAENPLKYAG